MCQIIVTSINNKFQPQPKTVFQLLFLRSFTFIRITLTFKSVNNRNVRV